MNRDGTFFVFTRRGCVSCLRACLGSRLLPQSYQYLNLSEGADSVGEGVTKSGRVWRKVLESDARSVPRWATSTFTQRLSSDTYWAIQRKWFTRVNALGKLSRKKSRKVAAHFCADF